MQLELLSAGLASSLVGVQQLRLVVATLGALVWATLPLAAASSAGDLLKLGDTAYGNGDYSAAIRHYTSAIDLDPATPLFYTKRAAAYISLKKYALALKDLDRAVEVDETFTQGFLHRGKLHRQMCSLSSAKSDFDSVLKLKPTHSAAQKELAALSELQAAVAELTTMSEQAAAHQLNRAAADELLQRVDKLAPDCVPAQLLAAKLEMAAANYEQATAITGRIVKSVPGHLEALTLRGQAYMYLGDHDMAKRHFGEALKFDPDHSASRKAFNKLKDLDRKRQRATRAFEAQEWQEAEDAALAALAVDPLHLLVNKDLHLQLCKVQQILNKPQEALQSCEAAIGIDGDFYEAQKERIRALIATDAFEAAVNEARNLLQQHQNDGDMHHLYREAEKRLKMSKRKDYYKILGVSQQADVREIKKAYRTFAKLYHPDKVHSSKEKAANEEKFKEIAEAIEVLGDEERRGAYDRGEDLEPQQGGGGHQHFHQHFQQGGYTFTFNF